MVDVGTGFYVEKSVKEAEVFYEGKVTLLGESLKEIEEAVRGKSENLRVVEDGMFFCSFHFTFCLKFYLGFC